MARILVMDDEDSVRTSLVSILQRNGHDVIGSTNGRDGMKLFRKAPTDLVITELIMPLKNGFDVILELKENYPDVRIIAISGKTGMVDLLPGTKQLGAWAVLPKPFKKEQILSTVESALEGIGLQQ